MINLPFLKQYFQLNGNVLVLEPSTFLIFLSYHIASHSSDWRVAGGHRATFQYHGCYLFTTRIMAKISFNKNDKLSDKNLYF